MEQLRLAYIIRLQAVARDLREALQRVSHDPEEVRLICHRLRGSAGAYSLLQLSELAALAEEAPPESLPNAVARLLRHIDTLAQPEHSKT